MKAVADIEFIISVLVFLTTISFITFMIVSRVSSLQADSISNNLKADSYEVSQLLLFDRGMDNTGSFDWWQRASINDVTKLGLSTGIPYALDLNKISKLNSFCNPMTVATYDRLKALLGQDIQNDVIITINTSTVILDCRPLGDIVSRPKFMTKRVGVVNNAIAVMEVSVIG